MIPRWSDRVVGLTLTLVALAASAAFAESKVETTTPFKGVTLHQRVETSPRPNRINVLVIDLKAPGLRFRVTPSNGDTPGETNLQTVRGFLTDQKAQLAINCSFYALVEHKYGDTLGLTVSDGEAYSPFTKYPALNISKDNVASIVRQADNDPTGFRPDAEVQLYNAVSGNEQILTGGKNTAQDASRLHPRTAVGIAPDNRLVIVTIDGRQKGVSEGMTTVEVADLLLEYKVTDALNLDGGGSTTLAIADPTPRLLNTPVGTSNKPGSERRNASNLAIFAEPTSPGRSTKD